MYIYIYIYIYILLVEARLGASKAGERASRCNSNRGTPTEMYLSQRVNELRECQIAGFPAGQTCNPFRHRDSNPGRPGES